MKSNIVIVVLCFLQNKKVYTPDNADVSGSCDRVGRVSEISISWAAFILSLAYGQDDINDTWFVSRFNLTYNLNDAKFPNAATGKYKRENEKGKDSIAVG